MGLVKYFWDTYAVIEFINGNPNYAKFLQEPVTITIFNLAEIFWVALREYDKKKAEEIYEEYKQCVAEIDNETLKEAIKFRKKIYKKSKISYADAVGYVYAVKNEMKFLTGDKEFRDLDGVEFVTK